MSTHDQDEPDFSTWIGRQEETVDIIDSRPMRLMQAMLDRPPSANTGDALPPLWHWLYFPTEALQKTIGPDGHPERGGFLPPVALPRRMWAGGWFRFEKPLRIGDTVRKTSTIKDVQSKNGRSGRLCFVTVEHVFDVGGEFCFSEEHDIVYRDYPASDAPQPAPIPTPTPSDWERQIKPDPVMLFRYSALTFNGHRIHYDRSYCREIEGYPGLVFHGPLTATLLIDLVMENNPAVWISEFRFRALAPLFDTSPFTIAGQRDAGAAELWATIPAGGIAMKATAVLS